MYALCAEIHCHGVRLTSAIAEPADEGHEASVTLVEDEYYVEIHHEMTRSHYISFAAAISFDGIQIIKLYSEGNAEARFKRRGVQIICYYCNRDGFYFVKPPQK